MKREYSDFLVGAVLRPGSPGLSRRRVLAGSSTLVIATAFALKPALAIDLMQIANGVNAAVSVITNVDTLAGRVWPKVKQFFESSDSRVSSSTASRIADNIDSQFSDPSTKAVSIAENRTPYVQQGNMMHAFDQQFSQAYIDWCTCNAQMNQGAANYWWNIARDAEQQGDYNRARIARSLAAQDEQNANMYMSKLTSPVYMAPETLSLHPGKPLLTAVSLPSQVTDVLDEGDYLVTHAVAQSARGSGLTRT
jgi:hypothetical protein